MLNENHKRNVRFEDITNASQLIDALSDTNRRLQKIDYIVHYTNLNSLKKIMTNKQWKLSSPHHMNDGLEAEMYKDRNEIFFASFMAEKNESMGMWSMYAQPWDDGIMICIPKDSFLHWIKNIDYFVFQSLEENQRKISIDKNEVKFCRVAYTESLKRNNNLVCGSKTNSQNIYLNDFDLVGYIKHIAWEYEKEIRVRINYENNSQEAHIFIPISDEVLKSLYVVTGPKFNPEKIQDLEDLVGRNRIKPSLFTGRLNWIPCNECEYKINIVKEEKELVHS